MVFISLALSLMLFGFFGAGLYEVIFRRRTKKYHIFAKQIEDGVITEMPKGYLKEPVKLKGFAYFLVIAGLGWLVVMGVGLLAFGACLVIFTGYSVI